MKSVKSCYFLSPHKKSSLMKFDTVSGTCCNKTLELFTKRLADSLGRDLNIKNLNKMYLYEKRKSPPS